MSKSSSEAGGLFKTPEALYECVKEFGERAFADGGQDTIVEVNLKVRHLPSPSTDDGTTERINKAAEEISDLLFTDSEVELETSEITPALLLDYNLNGKIIPTFEECELLVMGDSDGGVPDSLFKRFENVSKLIEDQF